jgi:predicted metal-dependent hydrolase
MLRFFNRSRIRRRVRRSRPSLVHFNAHKEYARAFILARLAHWHAVYGYAYGRVAIRNQSSRWGSCSKKGNLNFNYRIALLSPELMDYVIVHELCHLKEFNHSQNFWNLVAREIPEYKKIRNELRMIALHHKKEERLSS